MTVLQFQSNCHPEERGIRWAVVQAIDRFLLRRNDKKYQRPPGVWP
ncbi:hypothetical protein IQ13_0779 [Lacibacter cauensis]|uniref:Uncharacterized protein n=1 Tax=Lacibacter cauensis TaxID=510947 RepID=A0A562SY07_9BACT|nr:hypothetical protein IQ13_0779 [Lacibacter cauensis]